MTESFDPQAYEKSLETDAIHESSALFSLLSREIRLKIMLLIAAGPKTVKELVKSIGESQPLVSCHLELLREAGLITTEKVPENRRFHRSTLTEKGSTIIKMIHEMEETMRTTPTEEEPQHP